MVRNFMENLIDNVRLGLLGPFVVRREASFFILECFGSRDLVEPRLLRHTRGSTKFSTQNLKLRRAGSRSGLSTLRGAERSLLLGDWRVF